MNLKVDKIRKLLQVNSDISDEKEGFRFVQTKSVGLSNGYSGKSWSGYLSVLSLWREYIPTGDGKTGWIKV